MFSKRTIFTLFLGAILGILALSLPIKAKAQDNTLCGYFQDDGYYFYTFYLYNGQLVPSMLPYSADNFESTFGFRIDADIVFVKLFNPSYSRLGAVSGFDSFTIVDSCAPVIIVPTNTAIPPTNTSIPPTLTRIPPTRTPIPPTSTRIPPTRTPIPSTTTPTTIPTLHPPQLPLFKLPYSKDVKVYWTGGPHAYGVKESTLLYPSGQGSGMDFANGQSFQVLAMAAGKVLEASCGKEFGCQVVIKHDVGGTVLVYGHLTEDSITTVKAGQAVEQGTVLGMSGKTGSGGGLYIHLHIELRDGSGDCRVRCMNNKSFGNPIGWDDLVELVDGWHIGGYLADSDGKDSRNYDGSAVKGDKIDVIYNFSYFDNGKLEKGVIVRVGAGFKCDPGSVDCELRENNINPGEMTQFARSDRKGIAFPVNETISTPANQAGSLASSNIAKPGLVPNPSAQQTIQNIVQWIFDFFKP